MPASIRLATGADAAAFARIYAPHVVASPASFEVEPPDATEMARRIADNLATHAWLAFEQDGAVGGYAYGGKHRARSAYQWSTEVSVYVAETFRRRHIGQALYTSLFRVLAAQGYVNAFAGITLPNAASVALHESVGFAPIGVYKQIGYKLGQWHDVGWWQLALQPRPATPAMLRPVRELADDGVLEALLATGLPLVRGAAEAV
jgi:phosphinothricin acetyltransferase